VVPEEPPCVTATEEFERDNEKFFTTKLKVVVRLRVDEVPVTVIGYVPPGTVDGIVKVNLLVPGLFNVGALNVPVTPLGRPPTESDTELERDVFDARVIVLLPELPAVMVEFPELESEKPADTAKLKGVETVRLPLVAVTLSPMVPGGTDPDVLKVSVADPEPVMVFGEKPAVTPDGREVVPKVTELV
jgi:hypothetical protein